MRLPLKFFICLLLSLSFVTSSCGEKEYQTYVPSENPTDPTDPDPTDPSDPDEVITDPVIVDPVVPPPVVSAAAPLAVKITTIFDTTDLKVPQDFTETGTDTCEATSGSPVVTCTIAVPEGRLYFSSLTFTYSWLPDSCRMMQFQPYYYRQSVTTPYFPPDLTPGSEGLECGGAATAGCFGGAARFLVPNFPEKRSLVFLPDETDLTTPVSYEGTVPSGFSSNFGSNRHTVNDLAPAKLATTFSGAQLAGGDFLGGDGYIGGSYVNYQFSCRDNWYDQEAYIINIVVTDVDTNAAGANHIYTWSTAP